jgi:hypothetical protein
VRSRTTCSSVADSAAGEDALKLVREVYVKRLAELDAWADMARGTNRDDYDPDDPTFASMDK